MSEEAIRLEETYSAHNYHPLPVVFDHALGAHVWDPEGKEYLDFLSAYSAVNQGHCHPDIIKALIEQSQKVTLSSRAFYSEAFAQYAQFITEYFNYECVLPMNTGAEAVETALKLARRWGYMTKKIPKGEAVVLAAQGNFHGRTFGAISLSTDEQDSRLHFGPFLKHTHSGGPLGTTIRYGVAEDLEKVLHKHGSTIAAIILEPIQGEAGIVVPPADYFPRVSKLCQQYNVLLICDEIQTGIGRTGKLLCCEHYGIKPDIVLLGKALGGGVLPVSAVLSSRSIMDCFTPGSHGSTFGGNPLASKVAIAALKVIRDENLVDRSKELGGYFLDQLRVLQKESQGIISEVRGMGLLTAIVIDPSRTNGHTAWDVCLKMRDFGVLAKPTHDHIIRLAPPLVISKEDLDKGIDAIRNALATF
ncbi:similar to Saccharomyces cerevisiae YLR438W CAR2 L-ornithine transaminase (OTAse) [Maudiozyma saulgeensis]|uniref:Ornithine aminotransferase n=1 Tax=Maudiozyma saulgeensis TaxID=1789683 RepID=A0A1X7R9R6_9SACH|nr:similar to Saccharomyces cerevisiae YLR438W CAR2 L-ornithine transaminase (OTAse) [Kazachstania saulgeensis]